MIVDYEEAVLFVTQDGDFADKDAQLHDDLRADLGERADGVTVVKQLPGLVSKHLAAQVESLNRLELARAEAAVTAGQAEAGAFDWSDYIPTLNELVQDSVIEATERLVGMELEDDMDGGAGDLRFSSLELPPGASSY